jgi:hypothetical protein
VKGRTTRTPKAITNPVRDSGRSIPSDGH